MAKEDRSDPDRNNTAQALALESLGWLISEPDRAQRLLALTGLEPQQLRQRLGDPSLLEAVIAFLESHEPDLIACAAALQVSPERLVAARQELMR